METNPQVPNFNLTVSASDSGSDGDTSMTSTTATEANTNMSNTTAMEANINLIETNRNNNWYAKIPVL